eukprot:TRINITY_DN2353_c1_g3_i1.p1 TRINITY_DN2353_c1_g3~~TRINITY_DN2353_c1_g3_i1.p1  ORF type:complete len:149 (+),score=36.16 TRINITY_DN2353_c1_g3_i1:52-498(+)
MLTTQSSYDSTSSNSNSNSDSNSDSEQEEQEEQELKTKAKIRSTVNLQLNKLSKTLQNSYYEESNIFRNISLTFHLPSISGIEKTFCMEVSVGESIQNLKCLLRDKEIVENTNINLIVNNQTLLDPLSLNDIDYFKDKTSASINIIKN